MSNVSFDVSSQIVLINTWLLFEQIKHAMSVLMSNVKLYYTD